MSEDTPSKWRRAVRRVLGLREPDPARGKPGDTEELWRYGEYDAEVVTVSADLSTVDVRFPDSRFEPMQAVPVCTGIPGATWQVTAGAICKVGWTGGDPKKPYAAPSWKQGAAVVKLLLKADTVFLGDETGAKRVALDGDLVEIATALQTWMGNVEAALTASGHPIPVYLPTTIGSVNATATKTKAK